MIGAELGNFRILELLGEGGMGVVYKGVDSALDRPVAIKVLNTEYSRNPELVERFRAEARAQANLNHTNIATLYAFVAQGGQAWMVMELIEGETFSQMIQRRGLLPPNVAVPLFKQSLLGIGYAHRMGIIHRDIKPSNLMVNRQGIVKVMDFGIAKVMGSRGMTRTGTQMGTAYYMSPEQVMNKTVDIRSDIYSLGVTLYEMLTANLPFQGDSDFQIMSDHVHTPPPPPTCHYPYIPKGIENAVLKSLEKNQNVRFQTVEEFGAALERTDDFSYAPAATSPTVSNPVLPRPPQTVPPVVTHPGGRTQPPPATMPGVPPTMMPAAQPTFIESLPPTQGLEQVEVPQPEPKPPRPSLLAPLKSLLSTTRGKVIAGGAALALLAGVVVLTRPGPGPEVPEQPQFITPTPPPPKPQAQDYTTIPDAVAPADSATGGDLKVIRFGAENRRVTAGQKARLSWLVQGASDVTITPNIGTVKAEGSADVALQRTTEFTLVAKKQDGSVVRSTFVVEVGPSEPPPPVGVRRLEVSFEAQPTTVRSGQQAMLRWSVPGASSVMISPAVGTVPASGSAPVTPSQTTTYQLTARGPNGAAGSGEVTVGVEVKEAFVPVQPPQQPPPQQPAPQQPPPQSPPSGGARLEITNFDASPGSIQPGGAANLRWSLRNAHSASITPEPGVLRQSIGQYRVSPATTTTYTLTARAQDGTTATASTTVQVANMPVTSMPVAPPGRTGRAMAVVHDHGGALNAYAWPSCYGVLQVIGGNLRYTVGGTTDGRTDPFDIPLSQIEEVKLNRMRIKNNMVFHVKIKGQSLNFVPNGIAAGQAVAEIEAGVGRR